MDIISKTHSPILTPPLKYVWQDHAVCAQVGTDIFFVKRGGQSYAEARALCKTCPVIDICLEYALKAEVNIEVHHRFGMFGGRSPRERTKIAKVRMKGNSNGKDQLPQGDRQAGNA